MSKIRVFHRNLNVFSDFLTKYMQMKWRNSVLKLKKTLNIMKDEIFINVRKIYFCNFYFQSKDVSNDNAYALSLKTLHF